MNITIINMMITINNIITNMIINIVIITTIITMIMIIPFFLVNHRITIFYTNYESLLGCPFHDNISFASPFSFVRRIQFVFIGTRHFFPLLLTNFPFIQRVPRIPVLVRMQATSSMTINFVRTRRTRIMIHNPRIIPSSLQLTNRLIFAL